ncbi:MAG: hypothetical protein PHT50_08075 [Candidatus Omnitrophica bacterium]|nr:hypothetical protein [Candidatus Omnitrophota bacterium]
MPLICNKRSTTLFEVIVATVIFALVIAGMASVFVSSKRQIMHAMDRMTSSEMGKLFLDPLQLAVRQDNWDTVNNALTIGTTYCDASGTNQNPACPSLAVHRKVNNIDYTARYDISNVAGSTLRRVKLRVSWTEFSP